MRKLVMVLAALGLAGCDDSTGLGSPMVAVTFASQAQPAASMSMLAWGPDLPVAAITVGGTNGALRIDSVHAIVDRFELKRVDRVEDCDASGTGNPCRELEAPPSLVRLPVDAGPTTAVSSEVPVGEYDRLRFEIEDLDDDEEDPVKAQEIEQLFNEIRAQFPDWPRVASMRVVGAFTPEGGEARPFRAYLEGEIEVRLEFPTPFVVTDGEVSRSITVELNPRDWFEQVDGTVLDLSAYHYPTTGQTLEFSVEMRDGFKEVRHDG